MDKSKKLMSIFLSAALVLSTAGCSPQEPTDNDEDEDNNYYSSHPWYYPIFGGSRSRSYNGAISGNTSDPTADTSKSNIAGSGGISSGAKGGIGSGLGSAS